MSYASALDDAQYLGSFLAAHGVRYSIEIQPGRPGSGDTWHAARDFRGKTSHHTVSRPSNGLTPVLALCKTGRVDVPGPLCNGYGGYDEIYRILCMAWANHPGAGGALTLSGPYGAFTIPKDTARPYLFGTEYEGGIEPWTSSFHDFMSRSNAAVLEWVWSKRLGRRVTGEDLSGYHTEHKTWAPTRKTDRLGYSTEGGRDAVRPEFYATTPQPTPPPARWEPFDMYVGQDEFDGKFYVLAGGTRRELPGQIYADLIMGVTGQPRLLPFNHEMVSQFPDVYSLVEPPPAAAPAPPPFGG